MLTWGEELELGLRQRLGREQGLETTPQLKRVMDMELWLGLWVICGMAGKVGLLWVL